MVVTYSGVGRAERLKHRGIGIELPVPASTPLGIGWMMTVEHQGCHREAEEKKTQTNPSTRRHELRSSQPTLRIPRHAPQACPTARNESSLAWLHNMLCGHMRQMITSSIEFVLLLRLLSLTISALIVQPSTSLTAPSRREYPIATQQTLRPSMCDNLVACSGSAVYLDSPIRSNSQRTMNRAEEKRLLLMALGLDS